VSAGADKVIKPGISQIVAGDLSFQRLGA
jgi:hypothetical protein